jgi:hypothetical protein
MLMNNILRPPYGPFMLMNKTLRPSVGAQFYWRTADDGDEQMNRGTRRRTIMHIDKLIRTETDGMQELLRAVFIGHKPVGHRLLEACPILHKVMLVEHVFSE